MIYCYGRVADRGVHYRASVLAILCLLAPIARANAADESWEIHGQVVDEQGKPVEDFEAATFWSSNGKQWDAAGEWIKVGGLADAGTFWKEEGMLAARSSSLVTRLPEEKFRLSVGNRPRVSVFAIDTRHERGGYVAVEKNTAGQPITITFAPLVRVTAQIYCAEAGRTPDWSMAVIHPPGDRSNYLHFTHCGSLRGKISLLLPPGTYDFDVYSESPDASMRTPKDQNDDDGLPVRGIRVEVPFGKAEHDLGVLNVALPKDKGGIVRDYSQFYGKVPPELAITDARGVAKEATLAEFRGKWVLLNFWAV